MPWVQLIKIKCRETEDWASDEAYIKVCKDAWGADVVWDHVWGPQSMDEDDVRWLDHEVPPRSFLYSL